MDTIPVEIFTLIISFLDFVDAIKSGRVSNNLVCNCSSYETAFPKQDFY